jgi:esterase
MTEPVSRFVAVGGLRLHFFDWGNGAAPPLVLLHGLGESADVWRPIAPRLAAEFHVLAIDLRGHGDSDWHDTYSPQEQGDDIGELIGVLGLAPAAVVGLGMGGRAAALLAARQEHVLTRFVDIGAGVRMYHPAERQTAEAILDMPRVYETPEEYLRAWWSLRASLGLTCRSEPPAEVARHIGRSMRRLPSGGWAPKFDVDGYQRYRARSPGSRTVDYHDEFHEITTPALLVRGADSPLLPPDAAAATAAAIPGCRLVVVPGARHDVLADNPDGLLDAILPFLLER